MKRFARTCQANPFEAFLAVATIAAAVGYFVDPEAVNRSPIGRAFHPWDWLWLGAYAIGGFSTLLGLVRGRLRPLTSGLILITTALLIQGVAIVAVVSATLPVLLLVYVGPYVIIAAICIGRIRFLLRNGTGP